MMNFFRKSYEITGYALEGETFCINCIEGYYTAKMIETFNPIFLSSEFDFQPSCFHCIEKIDINLIEKTPLLSENPLCDFCTDPNNAVIVFTTYLKKVEDYTIDHYCAYHFFLWNY